MAGSALRECRSFCRKGISDHFPQCDREAVASAAGELKQEHKVSGLYERLEQQLSRWRGGSGDRKHAEYVFADGIAGSRQSGVHESDEPDLSLCAAAVKDVRTKCERGTLCLCEPEESARSGCGTDGILHLDMEQLGSTDVSVRMQNRSVRTNFYLEDDASL